MDLGALGFKGIISSMSASPFRLCLQKKLIRQNAASASCFLFPY